MTEAPQSALPRGAQAVVQTAIEPLRRLSCFATAPLLAQIPVRAWPKLFGRIHNISVPSRVHALPSPTPTCGSNINILLELLDRVDHVEGAAAECGVFQGSTLVPMALHLEQRRIRRTFYGFDSFEGFGASIAHDLTLPRTFFEPNVTPAAFSNTSAERVSRELHDLGLSNVRLIPGFFETSLSRCPASQFSFVHLDCDTYAAYRDCLEYFYPRLSRGAIVVFDEYGDDAWPGCKMAVDEFLADKRETLVEICRDNFVKTYFVKT
jgi:hypothetical protein